MKNIFLYIFLSLPFALMGKVAITGKVIPWKSIDEIDEFEFILILGKDTIYQNTFDYKILNAPGQYQLELFKIEIDQKPGLLKSYFSYGKRGVRRFWHVENHSVRLNARENNLEIECHLQLYDTGQVHISEYTIKKIYPTPENLKLYPIWDYKLGLTPTYTIRNNSRYLLYGQCSDGNFDGNLFKESQEKDYKRYYTGAYDLDLTPKGPLYDMSQATTWIRDDRENQKKFKIFEPGRYKYVVRLGFLPYELSSSFGELPYFSVMSNVQDITSRHYVKEYFELIDEFKIEKL